MVIHLIGFFNYLIIFMKMVNISVSTLFFPKPIRAQDKAGEKQIIQVIHSLYKHIIFSFFLSYSL